MTPEEKAREFLTKLLALCQEYRVEMGACGCCDGMSAKGPEFYVFYVSVDETEAKARLSTGAGPADAIGLTVKAKAPDTPSRSHDGRSRLPAPPG